jgi:arginase
MPRIAVLDAPSNLGLRPPTPNSVPGCAKAPGALRDHGLVARLGARDAGCHTPPRFDPGGWRPGDGVSQAGDIARYSVRLADRIGAILAAGEFPLILGGDCSIVLGSALAMRRLGEERGGRVGLIYVDAHSDFRHPGNASVVGAAAGEALALVTGRGQADLAAIEQRRPYIRDSDVVLVGVRGADEYRMDLQAGGFAYRTAPDVRTHGANRTAQWARTQLDECIGFWVHFDVDVLDPSVMPAVDAPDPGGIAYPELEQLLRGLLSSPDCLGLELTVFDPDFDVEGVYAADIVNTLVNALSQLGAAAPTLSAVRPLLAEIDPDFDPSNSAPVIPTQTKRTARQRRSSASTS